MSLRLVPTANACRHMGIDHATVIHAGCSRGGRSSALQISAVAFSHKTSFRKRLAGYNTPQRYSKRVRQLFKLHSKARRIPRAKPTDSACSLLS